MRILVISQYFYPETFRINDIVKELVKRGHTITVLTGLPNYPEGKIYDGYEKAYQKTEDYYGATVHRCKLRPRKKGAFNLALNYLSFVIQAKKTLKLIRPEFDVVFFYEPSPISSGIPAVWYGKKHHIKTVIYNLDIWPDCVRDSRGGKVMSKKNPIYLVAKFISNYVYKRFNLIVNKCDEFGDYLENVLHISKNKMVTLFEHAEDVYLNVSPQPVDNGIVDFMFLGNIGKAQNCDILLLAFSKLKHKNAKLHFVGDGSYLTNIVKLSKELSLNERVVFHGRHPINEMIEFYNLADVCLLSLSNETSSGLTPPAKLPSYMAACRPIIAAIDGSSKTIIEDSQCGFVCGPDDIGSLSSLMDRFCCGFEGQKSMGENGRNYFKKHFSLKEHIKKLESILLEVNK